MSIADDSKESLSLRKQKLDSWKHISLITTLSVMVLNVGAFLVACLESKVDMGGDSSKIAMSLFLYFIPTMIVVSALVVFTRFLNLKLRAVLTEMDKIRMVALRSDLE